MPFVKDSRLNYFYIPAILFLAGYIIVSFIDLHEWGGAVLSLFFLSLAIAFRGHSFLKGFAYTVMILAVVSLAMYYPNSFKTVGSLKSSVLIIPLLQVIMFGMGTELSLKDFAEVLRMPKGVIVGYWSARVLKFPERDCRTIALEVGMQNAGLASALATSMGKMTTTGLASVIFGTMMNVTGSSLASWWHSRDPEDKPQKEPLPSAKKASLS